MTDRSKRAYPPLLPAFVCSCLGIMAAVYLADVPLPVLFISFTIIITLMARGLKMPGSIGMSCLGAGLWGLGMMGLILYPGRAGPDISLFSDGSQYLLTGRITSFAQWDPLKSRYTLSCDTLSHAGSKTVAKVTGKIHLSVYKPPGSQDSFAQLNIPFGTRVRVRCRLRPIRNFSNPGGFDYERYLKFKGVTASAWTRTDGLKLLSDDPEELWVSLVQQVQTLRQLCLDNIMHHGISHARGDPRLSTKNATTASPAKAVLASMALGDKSRLSLMIKDSFARAGVSHLLSISGLHLSIIGLFSYLLFLYLLKPWHRLVVRGRARKIALGLTLIPLSVYAILAGFSPATQRALIMTSVFIMAMALEHETDSVNTLLAAGILILAVHPPSLFSISFQLSFSAVGGILAGMSWASRNHLIPLPLFWGRTASAFWVSLFAGIATLPLGAYYFNTVSFIFLVSNLVLVPIMGMVCLPLGLGAIALQFICPSLAGGILDLDLVLISLCLDLIRFMESLPLAWMRVITPTWLEILAYYLMVFGIFALLNHRKTLGVRLVCIAAAVGVWCAGTGLQQRFFPGKLTATALDVGQGASSVILTPEGRVILIDCGGFASPGGFNVGRYVVGPYLWRQRIRTIDVIVLSHPQADHMNGLGFIFKNFKVNQWIHNENGSAPEFLKQLTKGAAARQIVVTHPVYPATPLTCGKVSLWVMPPRPGRFSDLNQNSLVCRLVYEDFSMLFTGDIGRPREIELVQTVPIPLAAPVIMAPHHGSRSSGSKIFLDCVNPESVIVSCGYRNRYGFPHSDVLNRYKTLKTKVYRTDIHGAVTVTSSGTGYEINTVRNP